MSKEKSVRDLYSDKTGLALDIGELINEFKEKHPLVDGITINIRKESINITDIGEESFVFEVDLNVSI